MWTPILTDSLFFLSKANVINNKQGVSTAGTLRAAGWSHHGSCTLCYIYKPFTEKSNRPGFPEVLHKPPPGPTPACEE